MAARLTKEEKKIADDFASGKYKKVQGKRDYTKVAMETKEARINLRLQGNVLDYFKKRAEEEGIPYQTLINSYLLKIARGQLIERDDLNERLEALEKAVFKKAD